VSHTQSRELHGERGVVRYSPERAYRPLVSPPSVEDKDACAIYASVRRDATPSHTPIELAIPALQKMLHRAGNVDGEGDGCGLLLDLPRKIWAEEVRSGGHDPSLTLDDAFAVAHIFIERSQDRERIQHDARELLGRGGFRILAERIGVVDSTALGPTAREEEPHFWQLAGLVADASNRDRVLFDLMIELEERLDVHIPSFSATTCVYKVMGAPKILGEYYPDLRDERFETIGAFGHNRYSTNTWPSFKRVQPFSMLGHNGEINTIEQLRQEARMLGVPIQPGSSDSQDLNRTIDTLVSRDGLSLAEAMEMVVPPIVDEIRSLPAELQPFYMYLRQAMGPFAQGPVALIARHADPYERKPDKAPPERHIEASLPGEKVQLDCFYVGRLSGTKGTVWQYTAGDVASGFAWAELHATERNPRARWTKELLHRVASELKAAGWRLQEVTTDNGSEFRSKAFGAAVESAGARQRRIKAGRPNSNGCVERLQLTILEECWRPSFARSLAPKTTALARDLEEYLRYFNFDRAHTGRLTKGRVPGDIVFGARKTRTVR